MTIGSQSWMAPNLDYTAPGSWCYDQNTENCTGFGRLYTGYAAKSACPDGWYLPPDQDWRELETTSGGGDQAGPRLKSASGWDNLGNGTISSGFDALPGGYRYDVGGFAFRDSCADFWSASEASIDDSWIRDLNTGANDLWRNQLDEIAGFGVRCLKTRQ